MAEDSATSQARARWEAAALEALGGASLDSLTTTTVDNIEIRPLYTRESDPVTVDPGRPGTGTFRRGSTRSSTTRGWAVRQRHNSLTEGVNQAILTDLENGVTEITLANATDADALDLTLDDVLLDVAPINLAPGTDSGGSMALVELWRRRGHSDTEMHGCFGLDAVAALARRGSLTTTLDAELAAVAETARSTAAAHPLVASFDVDGTAFSDAGASDAQEMAAVLSGGLRYLRAMIEIGMSADLAANQIRFTLSVDADQFGGIAKLRAARQCWARIVGACGGSESARGMYIHAVTAWPMLTRRDPWVNMLRTTTACFAAACGGADAITVSPFDSALGQASELGLRIARNTQTIIARESTIGAVIDPAGGSWFVESLTDELAERAWSLFQATEARGGIGAVLTNGTAKRAIAAVVAERTRRAESGADLIVGVTAFPEPDEEPLIRPPIQTPPAPVGAPQVTCEPLVPHRWSLPFEPTAASEVSA